GDRLNGKQSVVVDVPVLSQEEANDRAKSILRHLAYQFITGSGQCIGQPDMRPGDTITIARVGQRFSGDYYVTKVEHTFGACGCRSSSAASTTARTSRPATARRTTRRTRK